MPSSRLSFVPFKQVDVFTDVPFKGNPVAVVFDTNGQLSSEQMQQIAKWTNLSETTFVVPKRAEKADYKVRIFTPNAELPFAGHPTIGTAHALLETGVVKPNVEGVLVQECEIGLVKLEVFPHQQNQWMIAFEVPTSANPLTTPMGPAELDQLENIFGIPILRQFPPRLVNVGPKWLVVQLADAKMVLDCQPNLQKMVELNRTTNSTGIVLFGEHDEKKKQEEGNDGARIEVRAFAPLHGVNEDPVCGSGNGAVGVFIQQTGQLAHFGSPYLASQGAQLGRAGLIRVSLEDVGNGEEGEKERKGIIKVAGTAITCIEGKMRIE